jgi:hypothetical protein
MLRVGGYHWKRLPHADFQRYDYRLEENPVSMEQSAQGFGRPARLSVSPRWIEGFINFPSEGCPLGTEQAISSFQSICRIE